MHRTRASALLMSVERPIVLVAQARRHRARGVVAPRNRQIGSDAAVLAAAPPAARRRRPAAGDDLRQPARTSRSPSGTTTPRAAGRDRRPLLLHDREIQTRCDDSVAAVVAGRAARAPPLARLRAARGFADAPCPRPVLAMRRAAEEHVLPCRGDAGVSRRRTSATWRTSRRSTRTPDGIERLPAVPRHPSRDRRLRPAPRLPVDDLCARPARGRGPVACSIITRTSSARWPSTASTVR